MEEVPDEDDSHQNLDTESNIYSQPNVHCSDRCSEHSPPPPDLDSGETWDFDFGNELPDLDCEDPAAGDLEPEMDDEVVEAPEISEENELKKFATLLSDAQEAARIQERELQKSSKRPKHYNRKSTTTLYRQRKAAKDLKQKGFLNVLDYIKSVKAKKANESNHLASTESEAEVETTTEEPITVDNSSASESEEDELPDLEELEDEDEADNIEVSCIFFFKLEVLNFFRLHHCLQTVWTLLTLLMFDCVSFWKPPRILVLRVQPIGS